MLTPRRRIARFARFYGMDTYRGAAMRWPTPDGVIPFRLFFALEAERITLSAEEQLSAHHVALLAAAQVHGGPAGKPARDAAARALVALAHPEAAHE